MALFTNAEADNSQEQDRDNQGYLYLPVPNNKSKPTYDSNNTFSISNPHEKYRVIGNPRRPKGGVETLKIDYSSFPSKANSGIRYRGEFTNKANSGIRYRGEFTNKARSGLFYIESSDSQRSSSVGINFSSITRFEILGTPNNDEIRGAENDDILNSGEGNDTITIHSGKGDKIDGGKGTDTLVIDFYDSPHAVSLKATGGFYTLSNGVDITTIKDIEIINATTGKGNDYIEWFGSQQGSTISTNNGNDTIVGGSGSESLDGGSGDDIIVGGDGNDYIGSISYTPYGGVGKDDITGVSTFSVGPGIGEIDYIENRYSSHTIRLGDASRPYYNGNTFQWTGDVIVGQNILEKIMPNATSNNISKYTGALYEAMKAFNITTPSRMSAFLAQIAVESASLRLTEENLYYTSETRMKQVFSSFFEYKNKQLLDKNKAPAVGYLRNPEKLGNYVYGGRYGNTMEGDGYKYRGRGLKQITFKDNYQAIVDSFKNVLGRISKTDPKKVDSLVDFIANPDLLARDPEYAALSAASFWDKNNLNLLADRLATAKNEIVEKSIFNQITNKVTGGSTAATERWNFYKKAKDIIKDNLGTYISDQEHAIIEGLSYGGTTKLVLHGQRDDYFLINNLQYEKGSIDYTFVVEQYKKFDIFPPAIGIVYDKNQDRILNQGDDLIALVLSSNLKAVESSLNFLT